MSHIPPEEMCELCIAPVFLTFKKQEYKNGNEEKY